MVYRFKQFSLDLSTFQLRRRGESIHLRPKVFDLIAYLVQQGQRVVSKDELVEKVWAGQYVDDSTLNSCIREARRVLGDSGQKQQIVKTIRGRGIQFLAPVDALAQERAAEHRVPERTSERSEDERSDVSTTTARARQDVDEPHRWGALEQGLQQPERPVGMTGPTSADEAENRPLERCVGEHKIVSVLACIIVDDGSVEVDPEARHATMEQFFTVALKTVEHYGGRIQQMQDDGVLAMFGTQVTFEDHVRRAILAATEIIEHTGVLGGRAPQQDHGAKCPVRAAVHMGRVLVSPMTVPHQLAITPAGDTLVLASRLVRQAAEGQVLLSDAALQQVRGEVDVEQVDAPRPMQMPGYRLLRMGPSRAVREPGSQSRFVGRNQDLEYLLTLFEQVEQGRGHVVGVLGEPGMGKSRLLQEFHDTLLCVGRRSMPVRSTAPQKEGDASETSSERGAAGVTFERYQEAPQRATPYHAADGYFCRAALDQKRAAYHKGRCMSYGQGTPYLPILDILNSLCGITETDAADVIAQKVQQHVAELNRPDDMGGGAQILLHLLGVAEAPALPSQAGSRALKQRTVETIVQLIMHNCSRHPLILEVEDLHWIDATSEECLAALVQRMAGYPLLLLTTYRPGYRPPWIDRSYAAQRNLLPLGQRDCQSILQGIFGATALPDLLVHIIVRRSEGNPFFIEELGRSFQEMEKDKRRMSQSSVELPSSIQAVIMARIDRLPPEEKRMLQVAAVVAKDVRLSLLQALTELPEETLRCHLASLQQAEFVHQTQLADGPALAFKHVLTQKAAYASLLKRFRKQLHQAIANTLLEQFSTLAEAEPELVAYHFTKAGLHAEAVAYWQRAGSKALERSAVAEAINHLSLGLKLVKSVVDPRQRSKQEGRLRTAFARAAALAG